MDFFQIGPLSENALRGTYNFLMVALSYCMAVFASYIAFEMAGRLRVESAHRGSKLWWLFGGAMAMGMGIWTMHFIAMLAFTLNSETLTFNPIITLFSLLIAIGTSALALFLLKVRRFKVGSVILGGIVLGLGIASMHFTGMRAIGSNLSIHYKPISFASSLLIAILGSEAALFLMIQSIRSTRYQIPLKIGSALIMGATITGVHYTVMLSAIFTLNPLKHAEHIINSEVLSFYIAITALLLLGIALAVSNFKRLLGVLYHKNEELLASKAVLEQKRFEVSRANHELQVINSRLESLVQERTQALIEARDKAIAANKLKAKFLAAISHDIKGPLNTLFAFSDLLLEESQQQHLSIEMKNFLINIRSNSQHVSELFSTISDLSKIESEIMTINKEEILLREFVEEIYEKQLAFAFKWSVLFSLQFDPHLPEHIIGDAKKIRKILETIFEYCFQKATHKAIIFSVAKDWQNITFEITLVDYLIPLGEHNLPFALDDQSPTEGHFLHLLLAHQFITLLKGNMTLKYQEDKNSVFTIQLPLV